MRSSSFLGLLSALGFAGVAAVSCTAARDPGTTGGAGGNTSSTSTGMLPTCGTCAGSVYTPCKADGKTPDTPITCPEQCAPQKGCVHCFPDAKYCEGNEVHQCLGDGSAGPLIEACDVANGVTCDNGMCLTACQIAETTPSNVGCEFWAVDLDQQDGAGNDPASADFGVALSNKGDSKANVTVQINEAPPGMPPSIKAIKNITVDPKTLVPIILPIRELDCGVKPNDYNSPGTCLSSKAFRIVSSAPIVVYQFNAFENSYSDDASLLLPTNALGSYYRVLGWGAGHPVKIDFPGLPPDLIGIDRSYVTIVAPHDNTHVTVNPSWRIKGNPPIAATPKGGTITATLNAFDVLNLETDDGTMQDFAADLSGSLVLSDLPVAVFTGVESTGAPGQIDIPKPPGWDMDSCCLDHLEDQLFPAESIGVNYFVPRSPLRGSSFHEADVVRFVGVAENATITTTLPAPFDNFTLAPGEVKTTWTQSDFTAQGSKPFMIAQILVSQGYTEDHIGDPSLTLMPPVEQYRTEYLMLTPASWTENYILVAMEEGSMITLDGASVSSCPAQPSTLFQGKTYVTHHCSVSEGPHSLSGDKPFGVLSYGYGSAGSYAVAGGADVKKIYEPPK
ncbi:MAG: IgGFc-binding protein [Polyangiaceae bacterium]